jgi:hypothetical protein
MRLADISITLRRRNPWEAIDLGAAMYRRWFRPLLTIWLAVYLPVLCACAGAFWDRLWVAWLVLWWLKPLFERFVLHVASRAAFGAVPSVRETLAAWREILSPMPWLWITILRPLYLQRSYTMPVSQLERQRGAERRARERVLGRRAMSSGSWLAVICAHFELAAALSIYVLGALLGPSAAATPADFWQRFTSGGRGGFGFTDLLIQAGAIGLVAPLFICSGFSLYLNRRAQLEAWDIEMGLRRIEERLASLARTVPAVVAALAVAVAIAVTPPPAQAAAAEAATATSPAPTVVEADATARVAIKRVLAAPEFQTYRTEKHWQPRERDEPRQQSSWGWGQLGALLELLAASARVALWIVAVAGVLLLIVLASRRPLPGPEATPRYVPPDIVLGMAIAPQSLPADIPGEARALIARGEHRAALALLYRGALSTIVHRRHVELRSGSTEREVLQASRAALAVEDAAYLERLVGSWSTAAYAGRPPSAAAGQALCDSWLQHFSGTPA